MYGDQGVVVWGITEEPVGDRAVVDFVDQLGITFPVLYDETGEVSREYSQLSAFPTAAFPQDWIVDVEGRVAYVNNGYEPEEMSSVIEAELAKGR